MVDGCAKKIPGAGQGHHAVLAVLADLGERRAEIAVQRCTPHEGAAIGVQADLEHTVLAADRNVLKIAVAHLVAEVVWNTMVLTLAL